MKMDHNAKDAEEKEYWQSLGQASSELRILSNEGSGPTRRDFLALAGFSLAAGLTGCNRAPVQKAIPLVAASPEMVPGVANWYATTCGGCASACGLVVKTRDGRPIKIEGNAESAAFGGGTCATGQATVLSLYDDERLRGPHWNGRPTSWEDVDQRVAAALDKARNDQKQIVLLSGTIISPSTREILTSWKAQYPTFRHIEYDAVSYSSLRGAQAQSFGRDGIPHYHFDKARVVVGIEADFLGTWLSPVEFARQYSRTRTPEAGSVSHHVQFESGFSVTGSNADLRIAVAPSDLLAVAASLLQRVAQKAGVSDFPTISDISLNPQVLDSVASKLWQHRGESLIVSGIQDLDVQVLVSALNVVLGNIGKTLDVASPSTQRAGNDSDIAQLLEEMEQGAVGVLLTHGVNPGYDYPQADRFVRAMQKVQFVTSLSDRRDETSSHAHAICPDHHFLEAWGDAEPFESYYSLAQPLINPLFNTRAAQESLLRWIGKPSDYYAYLREFWRDKVLPKQTRFEDFDTFWDNSLRGGVLTLTSKAAPPPPKFSGDWRSAARRVIDKHRKIQATRRDDLYEVQLYESVAMRDGRHANNPWLQELPDPITKLTWGNAASVSPSLAKKLGLTNGDIVTIKTDTARLEIPVQVQPGQESRTLSIPLGYGRKLVGKAGENVGNNAYPLVTMDAGVRRYSAYNVTIEKTGKRDALASTQTHFSLEGRPIVKEITPAELVAVSESSKEPLASLWAARPEGDHSWGMVIDLSKCTGCSACVIACQAENNIAVVGRDQIQRTREMHWIRVDRYYSGSEENPTSVHQPMMCQHCGRAPCETVCPVLATTHSSDGLNQQVYNRCIGTRYCANNCPYKVRRFNWLQYSENPQFDYDMENALERMVLNPDVSVRSRGVMEKCSLCIQRIQAGKNQALQEQRPLADGEVKTACQQVCPAEAIVFGDLKDPRSNASQLRAARRYYHVLEDLGTLPNVGYMSKVRNLLET